MDTRRLRLLPLGYYKLKYLWHWLAERRDWQNARSYIWATLFSRDSGLALQDPLYRWFPKWAPYPKQLEIETTTVCNLKCVMCEHTYWGEPSRHMSYEQFRKIVDQFPELRWIGVTGIGSSFMNPDYPKMIRHLKKDRRCFVEFFDHFCHIKHEHIDELVGLGVNKIWVSLESASHETHSYMRKGSDFSSVLSNVRYLVNKKVELGSPIPETWFHFIITQRNQHEMEDYVEMVADLVRPAKGMSAPLIYWTNMMPFDEVAHMKYVPDAERMKALEARCREHGIFSVQNENVTVDKPMSQCAKWNEPFVLVSGHLQPCCCINMANDRPHQERSSFVNMFFEDFKSWWNSEEKLKFARDLKQGNVPDACRDCHVYRHPEAPGNTSIRDHARVLAEQRGQPLRSGPNQEGWQKYRDDGPVAVGVADPLDDPIEPPRAAHDPKNRKKRDEERARYRVSASR